MSQFRLKPLYVAVMVASLSMVACGGGGGGVPVTPTDPTNPPPITGGGGTPGTPNCRVGGQLTAAR